MTLVNDRIGRFRREHIQRDGWAHVEYEPAHDGGLLQMVASEARNVGAILKDLRHKVLHSYCMHLEPTVRLAYKGRSPLVRDIEAFDGDLGRLPACAPR